MCIFYKKLDDIYRLDLVQGYEGVSLYSYPHGETPTGKIGISDRGESNEKIG